MGLSGADLEYQRMLFEAGISPTNPVGYDGARLEQLGDARVAAGEGGGGGGGTVDPATVVTIADNQVITGAKNFTAAPLVPVNSFTISRIAGLQTVLNDLASLSFTPTYANAPVGSLFKVIGLSTTARPTSRANVYIQWQTTDGLSPINALTGDEWLNAIEVP